MMACLTTCEAKVTLFGFYSMMERSREAPKRTKQTCAALSSALASTARAGLRPHLEACQDCTQPAVAMWDAGSPVGLLGQPGQQQLGGRRAVAHDTVQGTAPLGQVVLQLGVRTQQHLQGSSGWQLRREHSWSGSSACRGCARKAKAAG